MNTCCNQIKRIIEDQKRFEREMMQYIAQMAQIKTEVARLTKIHQNDGIVNPG